MSNYAVFITAAARVTPKVLNGAFVLMHDFKYNEWPPAYGWVLLTSKELPTTSPRATAVPLPAAASTSNEFTSLSLAEISVFVRTHERELLKLDITSALWLVIDQRGLETSTGIVCREFYYPAEEKEGMEETQWVSDFRACRLPYEETWGMITNLELAKINFEDEIDEGAGVQLDGSWKWKGFGPNMKEDDTANEEVNREKALKALRDSGDVD
ncbi:hypothetical protein B0H19DRAFT_1238298 [Mycena capillaripes]|nr:hypothetical protein B0H19DRAFT_1238298 [Mycena capillaripes]